MAGSIRVTSLGQSGFRFEFPGCITYIDPYLSDHVATLEGPQMARRFPLPVKPQDVTDADLIAVTHAHLDHCDLQSLVPMSAASTRCRIVCPNECAQMLQAAGVAAARIVISPEDWVALAPRVRLISVPAAHPAVERDAAGQLRFVGYVFECDGRRLYHAGDTSPNADMIGRLADLGPIDTAFLPVNERNYYRESRGIIGNMTVREAFQLATDLKVRTMVPMHWDMFAPNSVYLEEIRLLYDLMKPPFEMCVYPEQV